MQIDLSKVQRFCQTFSDTEHTYGKKKKRKNFEKSIFFVLLFPPKRLLITLGSTVR